MSLTGNGTDIFAPPKCPTPLLEESKYSNSSGYIPGRYCGVGANEDGTVCCFPCPIQEWVYPADWKTQLKVPNYLSILSLLLCLFLLLSFALLPPEKTQRHYLSVGLLFPVLFISLSFVIPAGHDPPLCYDDITPNDMHSSLSCAWTGAFVAIGGLGSVVWVFLRSLWLHIRIFWDRDPGQKFKWGSIAAGTVLPAIFLTALLAATGVSYRMGLTCLPNHPNAIASFWIWLVGFAIAGFILQALTTGYCIWVFVRARKRERERISQGSLGRNSANEKVETWRHVKRLFLLQWRNILVSVFVIIGSISFFIVFWSQDRKLGAVFNDPKNIMPVRIWITCLILSEGDKEQCLEYVHGFTVNRQTVLASLILASLVGIEIFILLARVSMFSAWRDLLARPFPSLRRRPGSPLLTSLEGQPHTSQPLKASPLASTFLDSDSSPARASTPINRTDSNKSRFHLGILRPNRHRKTPDVRAHAPPEILPSPPTTPSAPPTSPSYIPTRPPNPPPPPGSAYTTHNRVATPVDRAITASPSSAYSNLPNQPVAARDGGLQISAPVPGSFAHVATGFPPQRIEAVECVTPPSPTRLGRGRSVRNAGDLPGWAREREERRVREGRESRVEVDGEGEGGGRIVGRGGLGMNPLW
ncbi:hypothetical protein BU16DRAFT_556883 [Lophium mytilinum]|uniref:G-protein coupled receptors family 2 profile 2 domain-containing protein n=1 Tax=Lophium mytilinum TaxID=390894 RepID=A0A6A6R9K3_9PEZI|nr:hypothetical protein BU16DRAFT_556883 [Lophium mytilinum]